MERFIHVNSLANGSNRLLFRFPIYRNFGFGDKNINTMKSYNSVLRRNFYSNHINCRQNSSKNDGQTQSVKLKLVTRDKVRRFRTLETNVTQVTGSSSSQKQQSVKLVNRSNLPQFLSESKPNVFPNPVAQVFTLKEEPMVFMPDKFKMKLQNNSELVEKFWGSFENFLKLNPQPEFQVKESVKKLEPLVKPLEPHENELQKEFDSAINTDAGYQQSLNQSLKCYINACVSENLNERAFAVLMSIRKSNPFRKHKVDFNDPELYIDLMTKYSSLQNWTRVNEIYEILLAEKIPITPQIYMIILDCLGRMNETTNNVKLIEEFINKAIEQNFKLNDIMDKSAFIRDQRQYVLQAIRRVHADFSPVYTPPALTYSNKMLEPLNEDVRSIDETVFQIINKEKECLISKPKRGFTAAELNAFTAEQIVNENEGHILVKNITMLDSSKHLTPKVKQHRELLDKLTDQWQTDIASAIRKRLGVLQHKMKKKSTQSLNIYPYMRLLTPEQYTEILIDELKLLAHGCELYSPTVVQIYGNLGKKVMLKYQIKMREQNGINKKVRHLYRTYREALCSGNCSDNPRQLWQRIAHHSRPYGPCIFQRDIVWPWPVMCEVGRTLFKILLENIKIDVNLLDPTKNQATYAPVVFSLFRKREHKSREEIRPHPVFARLLRESKLDTMRFQTNEVPMLCPPLPWTSPESGGYLQSHTTFLRLPPQFSYQNELVNQVPREQLYPTLDAINQLGSIPWMVNERILDLAIKIFNLGGDEKLDVPLTPDDMLNDEHLKYRGMTKTELEKIRKDKDEKYEQRQNELLSLYTDTLYKLSLANHFRGRPFWLPTNLDFRGRTYPVPPHLTHLSADLTRSMLCFHQKQPLGESGLDWLKLHCINLTGMKKRDSVSTRLAYANEIIDDIIDSADNPLDGRQWWLKSDEPWQTLAACMEITNAIRSPNPVEYMSGFPIHQDGSCNGLQHYAALGRDHDGAVSVNLAPAEVPQDVYSTIANRVEELRKEDAANGVQIAIDLEGVIKRKIVKQTVMTTVYGVTPHGARLQIKKQLKNIDFPSSSLGLASAYLTKKTFASLSEMFKSAREIQDWLTDSARYISGKSRSKHVEWTSPLGLPVIQPYTKHIQMSSNVTVNTIFPNKMNVNRVKEKNAFSPNFIHSLDSCHMMLTSLNCEKAGVTFVSVHDCFWTHPNTVPIMNQICREQFILLHSQPILEDLAESFYQKYETEFTPKDSTKSAEKKDAKVPAFVPKHEHVFMKLPKKGNFNLESVLDSTYFFS